MPWLLPKLREASGGNFDLRRLHRDYYAVIEEINAERERELYRDHLLRAIRANARAPGLPEGEQLDSARRDLTRMHMAGVRYVTSAPAERVAAVRRIALSHRLGLLSNFDDSQMRA